MKRLAGSDVGICPGDEAIMAGRGNNWEGDKGNARWQM
jgi:hypothetical protein